jgi:hypothetical protein
VKLHKDTLDDVLQSATYDSTRYLINSLLWFSIAGAVERYQNQQACQQGL